MTTRKLLAIAAAPLAAMTLFASAAEACISCEYVPEVVRNSTTSTDSKPSVRSRSDTAVEQRRVRPEKRRVVKEDSKPARKVETAKAKPAPVVESTAENEHSTVTTAGSPDKKVEKAEVAAPAKSGTQTETSTIATAVVERADAQPTSGDGAQVSNIGCKKFFPTVGMTLTVPCE
jgi:hypothetical protein